jgi:outer membrane protein, multidrug efflux system
MNILFLPVKVHPAELRALDLQVEISNRTVKTREESLKLVKTSFSYGWDSLSPMIMTENRLYAAEAVVPDLKQAIEQQEKASRLSLKPKIRLA